MPYEESEMAIPSDMRSCLLAYKQLNLMKNSNFANMVRQNQWDHEFEIPTESAVDNNDDYWSDTDSLDKTEGTLLTADITLEQLSLEVGVETEIGNNLIKGLEDVLMVKNAFVWEDVRTGLMFLPWKKSKDRDDDESLCLA
jgi:hypothetical protein